MNKVWSRFGLAAGLLCLTCAGANARAQNKSSTILVLKDPTPREPDLDRIYNPGSAPGVSAAQIAAYNQQRFQLISRASESMQSLASVLQRSVARHPEGSSFAPEEQVVVAIEALAGNVYKALTGHTAAATRTDTPASARVDAVPQLSTQATELAALTVKLQDEVKKSSPDALPVGVLLSSAKVRDLAHSLKEQMQP